MLCGSARMRILCVLVSPIVWTLGSLRPLLAQQVAKPTPALSHLPLHKLDFT